ncbi:hypothetical protein GCM10022221_66380 [Actinocorallia aurea]
MGFSKAGRVRTAAVSDRGSDLMNCGIAEARDQGVSVSGEVKPGCSRLGP